MQATPAPMMPPPIGAPHRDGMKTATAKPPAVIVAAANSDSAVRLML